MTNILRQFAECGCCSPSAVPLRRSTNGAGETRVRQSQLRVRIAAHKAQVPIMVAVRHTSRADESIFV